MTATTNTKILADLFHHLSHYAHPDNPDGFFPSFLEWVIRDWSFRPYFRMDPLDAGDAFSAYPVRTEFTLKEMQPSYRDFIHSLNGKHHPNPSSPRGVYCETLERDFYEYFHEAMRIAGLRFLENHHHDLDADDFWDKVFLEDFKTEEEIRWMDKLCMNFGFFARAAEPYTCARPDQKTELPGRFADWFLEDFKQARIQDLKADMHRPEDRWPPKLYPSIGLSRPGLPQDL